MLNARSIQGILVLVAAFILAIWLGLSIVTSQTETIFRIIGVSAIVLGLLLGRKIWLLVPLMVGLGMRFTLPGSPSSDLIGFAMFLGFSVPMLLLRKLPLDFKRTELGFWTILLILMVIQVYLRNPAGLSLFGTENIGGKPYAIFAITVAVGFMLSGLVVPPQELKVAMYLSILGAFSNLALGLIGRLVPAIGIWYGAIDLEANSRGELTEKEVEDPSIAGRNQTLAGLGKNLSLFVASFISPIRACFHPIWGTLMLISIAAAAMGGFRSTIAMVGLTYFVALLYRSGFVATMISLIGGVVGLAIIAIVNSMAPLPPNMQRALSFLPGTWEERHVRDAEGSSEWRFEMWREALTSDAYIRNKWLGDGLGMTADELRRSKDLQLLRAQGRGGFDIHRENIMINGDFHSGPVQTIKTIGYAGLLVLILAQVRLAVHAHRQILRCRNTEWFPVALFIGIPLIWNPFFFVFIFGSFQYGVSTFLLGCGMMRLLEKNLPLPAYVVRSSKAPYVLMQHRTGSVEPSR